MEVKATARFVRMSPRKVRLVVDLVRGLPVAQALTQLRFLDKAASEPVYKVIASAAANAEHNFGLKREDLFVKAITADGGPVLQRWRARAFGRAAPIRKRTTHISVTLDANEGAEVPPKKPETKERAKVENAKKGETKKSTANAAS